MREQSEKRIAASEDFQKVEKKIDHYVELKERKTVPLNEEKFLNERAEFNTDKKRKSNSSSWTIRIGRW